MRVNIYKENESSLEKLSRCVSTSPTKFINEMLITLSEDCHKELAEEIYATVKRSIEGRARTYKN